MGVRFIISFYLLSLVVCREANGARNVLKQEPKEEDAPYITSYGIEDGMKEVGAPYITQYGTKEGKVEQVEAPYITQYGTEEGKVEVVEAPYITGYISAEGNTKEVETPYITGYISAQDTKGTKEVEAPYITGYISKRDTKSTKDVEAPYITQYQNKEASYNTQYGTKEGKNKVEEPYLTGYKTTRESKEVEAPYVTGYISAQGTKLKKEVEAPYITGYISAQGSKLKKEVEAPYITGYISAQGTNGKEVEAPYITGYISAQGTKLKKEVEAPYITGYISAQGAKNGEHQKHVHPPSQNGAKDVVSGKELPMEHQHHDHMHAHSSSSLDHTEALKQGFFTFEDFYKGNALPLNFPKQDHSRFLPKATADSIPFSTSQLPHLLQLFSTPRDSRDAKHMAWTLDQCELKPIKGETKFCATSLESMIDFVQKIIGSGVNFNILSTTHPETSTAITQKYTILDEPKQVLASKMVFCHPVPYPYAVFFCHHFENDTKFFKVSLGGENGDKVEAVAVCHMDTSDWDPNHSLFRLLGIKAGASSPVCHFFPGNHLVWIPSSPTTATF